MPKSNLIRAAMVVTALAIAGHVAADDRKAGALLQAADAKATIEGDSKAAIALYKEAVAEAGSNQVLKARALFGLAEVYRRVDPPTAEKTYADIVRDFAGPKDVVASARARLMESAPPRPQNERPALR